MRGLDYGADEYLLKPVGNKELVARVRAVLRRDELPSSTEARREITYVPGCTKGVRLIKIMTEAIQMVRGEIATPPARNDREEKARNDGGREGSQ